MKQNYAELAHDLKMPIQLILSCAQLLEMEVSPGSSAENYLKMLMQSTWQLQSMLKNALDGERLQGGQVPVRTDVCDAAALAKGVCARVRPYAGQKGIALVFSTNVSEFRMAADREKLERILQNLISNALKFTPRGGRVGVDMQARGDAVEFCVSDTGCGIAEWDQKRIFQRGVTSGGHGYGLHIAQQFAEMMGGGISVESRLGCGSRFTLRLPLRGADPCGGYAS